MNEPKCLTRMKLSECWGDTLNAEELKEINAYIEKLEKQLKQRDEVIEEAIKYVKTHTTIYEPEIDNKELLKILQRYKGDNK